MNAIAQKMKTEFKGNELLCSKVVTLFQLISNKTRFRIICLLTQGEFCVRDIVQVVSEDQATNISQQLKILALAGVIERRREEKWIFYRLRDQRVRRLIEFLRKQFVEGDQHL